jgi:hypothetical protein
MLPKRRRPAFKRIKFAGENTTACRGLARTCCHLQHKHGCTAGLHKIAATRPPSASRSAPPSSFTLEWLKFASMISSGNKDHCTPALIQQN